jgi:hypothetical protein
VHGYDRTVDDAPDTGTGETSGRRRSRRGVLFIVLGAAGFLLALGIGFSVLQATVRASSTEEVALEGARAVDVSTPDGDITIEAGAPPGGLVADAGYFLRAPKVDVSTQVTARDAESEARTRKVAVSCGWPSACDVDVSGTVPAGTDVTGRAENGDISLRGAVGVVDIRSEAGNVSVDGAARDVRIASADGDVRVDGVEGAVRAEAVAGDMDLNGLSGTIRARSGEGVILGEALTSGTVLVEGGNGGVRLRFAAPPDRVELDVAVGPAEIQVPAGRYRIDADVNQGDLVVSGIVRDPAAERSIVLTTRQGDATIEATQ